MQPDRNAERPLRRRDAGDVVEMRVGEEDVFRVQPVPSQRVEQLVDLVAGIDDHGFAGLLRSRARIHF